MNGPLNITHLLPLTAHTDWEKHIWVGAANGDDAAEINFRDESTVSITREEAIALAKLIVEAVNTHDALQAENERLREQVRELRAGLVPFAKAADGWHDSSPDSRAVITWPAEEEYNGERAAEFTFGDLRRARALLTPQEPNNG